MNTSVEEGVSKVKAELEFNTRRDVEEAARVSVNNNHRRRSKEEEETSSYVKISVAYNLLD